MSENKHKNYPPEFKESAIKLANESKQSVSKTAKDLGLNVSTLHNWINKYTRLDKSGVRTDDHLYEEVRRLKKELIKVTQKRELLKKAAAYFARESQ